MSRHDGISCDGCALSDFTGKRFKCLVCGDYDLCARCFDQGKHDHPMQCILTKKDFLLYYGEQYKGKAHSYTCPCCGQMGFTVETLLSHATALHSEPHSRVLCPVCVPARHIISPTATEDIVTHIQNEHIGGVRDIVAMLDEAGGGGIVLNRRNNLQLRFPEDLIESSSTFSSLGQSVESVRPFSEFFTQLTGRSPEFGPVFSSRNVSKTQGRLGQGRQKNSGTSPPPPPHCTDKDTSGPFLCRSLEPETDPTVEHVNPTDRSQFVQEVFLSCLNSDITGLLRDTLSEDILHQSSLVPPEPPPFMADILPPLPLSFEEGSNKYPPGVSPSKTSRPF